MLPDDDKRYAIETCRSSESVLKKWFKINDIQLVHLLVVWCLVDESWLGLRQMAGSCGRGKEPFSLGFGASGTWHCVTGLVFPDILIGTQCLQSSRFEGCENSSLTPWPLKCIEPHTQWHSFASHSAWIINSAVVAVWSLTRILVYIKFWEFSVELKNWFRFSSWILLYGVG